MNLNNVCRSSTPKDKFVFRCLCGHVFYDIALHGQFDMI